MRRPTQSAWTRCEFRMKNLTDPRLRAVLQAAADKFDWAQSKSTPQRGFGIACGNEKGGYVATCVEVEMMPADNKVKIRPRGSSLGVRGHHQSRRPAQPGYAERSFRGSEARCLKQIQFANGRILNPHFAQYRVPRFRDTPQIEMVLIDRKDLPSAGAGESGIMGLAPAVGNAIFAATGTRLRNMPMAPSGAVAVEKNAEIQSSHGTGQNSGATG